MPDLILRSKRVLTPLGIEAAAIIIIDGKIQAVLPYNEPAAGAVHDVGDLVIMPGMIDPHVHINEPGRTEWEGFDTATRAAIAGGLTTLVDMPLNSAPVTTSAEAFDEKIAAAKLNLHTNVGFWGGIVPGNEAEIEPLIQKGVLGFKAFLTHSGIDDFPNVTESDLRKAMPLIARHNLPLLVHCELESPGSTSEPKKTDPDSYPDYLASRPEKWENDAIALMIRLCEEFNCRVHIVHLSSAGALPQIAEAKQKGLPVTVETGQHYLYFNAKDIGDGQTQFKCAPPIRSKANNDQLWAALAAGTIDFVATDHSPSPPDLKQLETGDFTCAWGGIASLQFALPVLWTAAEARGFTLEQVAQWLSGGPAVLAGLEKSKGKIKAGYDADLIIWDPVKTFVVAPEIIHHKHKITPYMGQKLSGVVEETYIAGELVFANGDFKKLNSGKIILHR